MKKNLFFILCALTASNLFTACDDNVSGPECDDATYASICTTEKDRQFCSQGSFTVERCDGACDRTTGRCTQSTCAAGNKKWTCSEDLTQEIGCKMNADFVGDCPNGCNPDTGRCKENTPACDTTKCPDGCNPDGSCKEDDFTCDTAKCPNGCNDDGSCVANVCDYRCNKDKFIGCLFLEDQAERIFTCFDGETCNAEAGGCVSNKANECNDGEKKCMDRDDPNTALNEIEDVVLVCKGGRWVRSIDDLCEVGICQNGECKAPSKCQQHCADSVTLITCNADDEEVRVQCGNRCDPLKNACASDACDAASFKTDCRTVNERLVCGSDNKLKGEACPKDKPMCALGECYAASASDTTCTNGVTCSDDGRFIITCKDNNISTVACGPDKACKESSEPGVAPTCERAVWDVGEVKYCDSELFNAYCDTDKNISYNCERVSEGEYQVKETQCKATESCTRDGGITKCTSSWYNNVKIGDKCDAHKGEQFCQGDVPMECNDKGYIHAIDDDKSTCASRDNMFCAVRTDAMTAATTAECYEPCNKLGKYSSCFAESDRTSVMQVSCEDIDGRLGIVMANATGHAYCDFGCAEGKCVDYTKDIENIGESCNPTTFESYCTKTSPLMAVTCDTADTGSGSSVEPAISAERCFADEECHVVGGIAKCAVPTHCNEGDAGLTCGTMLGAAEYSIPTICKKQADGSMAFEQKTNPDGSIALSEWTQCTKGCDTATGKCK